MSSNDPENILSTVDSRGVSFGERLRKIREATEKTPHEVANASGLSIPTYYDLENCPGDLSMTVSLFELSKLASVLGVSPRDFFSEPKEAHPISPEELSDKIKAHLALSNKTITDFEDEVGFVIEPALHHPSKVLDWNVDCLRFVCLALGIDWLPALPKVDVT